MTDHKALIYLLTAKQLNRRLYGWLLKLLDFTFEIEYRARSVPPGCRWTLQAGLEVDGLWDPWDFVPVSQPRAAESSAVGGDVGPTPQKR